MNGPETQPLQLRMLGGFELRRGDETLISPSWPHGKAKALLKLLALQPQRRLHREQVIETLWGHLTPKAAAANLRKNLHFLRTATRNGVEAVDIIQTDGDLLALAPDVRLDFETLQDRATEARQTATDPALYERALELYSGDLLAEDLYEEWTVVARGRLLVLHRELLVELGRLYEATGRVDAAVQCSTQLVDGDPLDEASHRTLMRLFARSGDRAAALRQYQASAEALREQLGVEPSAESQTLRQQVADGELGSERVTKFPILGGFVGRRRQLMRLREALNAALEGQGRVVLLTGEPGIGKTRLAQEVASYAALRGARVLWGSSIEADGAPAFWPWIQILRSLMSGQDGPAIHALLGASAPFVAELMPELRERLPQLESPTATGDPAQARFLALNGIAHVLNTAAEQQPLVIVLDDMHFADEPSLLLFQSLARENTNARILLLGAYRDTEAQSPTALGHTAGELARYAHSSTIGLSGMSSDEAARLIEITAGESSTPLTKKVYELTAGNPLYISELAHLLADVTQDLDAPGLDPSELVQTNSVGVVIRQRLAVLSKACRKALEVASVIGQEFGLELVAPAANLTDSQALQAMDEARNAAIVVQLNGETRRYKFRHGLIQQALYVDLELSDRAELHGRVAKRLEALHSERQDAVLAELARHFREASSSDSAEKALHYGERAALQAADALAYEDAIDHYHRTLEIARRMGCSEESRCDLLLGLGDALWRQGNHERAGTILQEAASVARALCDAERFARAALSIRGTAVIDDVRVRLSEEALELLDDADSVLRARVLAGLARTLVTFPGSRERRDQLSWDAVDMARRLGDAATLADALDARHFVTAGPWNVRERLESLSELVSVAEKAGATDLVITGHYWRLVDLLELGDTGGAESARTACLELIERFPMPFQSWRQKRVSATFALLRGEFDDAEPLAQEAFEFGQRIQEPYAQINYATQLGLLRREQGRLDELEPAFSAMAQSYPTLVAIQCFFPWLYIQVGRMEEARELLGNLSKDGFAQIPQDGAWSFSMALLAEVCASLREERKAQILYEFLVPYANRSVVLADGIVYFGSVSHYLGLLASATSQWVAAEEHFDFALDAEARSEASPWVARTQHSYGDMLLRRASTASAQARDHQKARALLKQAREAAGEMGMRRLAESTARLIELEAPS